MKYPKKMMEAVNKHLEDECLTKAGVECVLDALADAGFLRIPDKPQEMKWCPYCNFLFK